MFTSVDISTTDIDSAIPQTLEYIARVTFRSIKIYVHRKKLFFLFINFANGTRKILRFHDGFEAKVMLDF